MVCVAASVLFEAAKGLIQADSKADRSTLVSSKFRMLLCDLGRMGYLEDEFPFHRRQFYCASCRIIRMCIRLSLTKNR